MAALSKKERIYKLTDPELVALAYDFTDGIASEWIGEYMDDHPDVSSAELFQQLNAQFGEIANVTEAARALIRIKQNQGETLAELVNRMMKLARIAYHDSEHREGRAVQVQLAEYFIDALNNPFIKQDVARANPETLSDALTVARESERLFERLNPPQKSSWETARKNNSEGWKTYNGQGYWGPRSMSRVPKVERRHDEWSREVMHPSEGSCCGHGKSTHLMNCHYFDKNIDIRTTEGRIGEDAYHRSGPDYSQMTRWAGERRGNFPMNSPGRETWPNRGQGVNRGSEDRRVGLATGTKGYPNYRNQGNFQGPPQ